MNGVTVRIPEPEEYGEHIARLNQENLETKQEIALQKQQIDRLEQNYMALTTSQTETKTLVGQLIQRFGDLDNRLFGVFQQMTKDNAQLLQQVTMAGTTERQVERQEDTKERTVTLKAWITFGTAVVSATIGALIVYLFTKGGA